MKCFIYCRQSVGTNEADDSLSLVTQKEECVKLAKAKGLTVLDIFEEPNKSGRLYPDGFEALASVDSVYKQWAKETKKTGKWRTQLGKMLRRLGEAGCVLCYDITRLHRSLRGSFLENLIIQELSKHKVKLITAKEGEIDFDKFSDSIVSTLTSQINSEQLLIQKEKSLKARKSLKERGEWCSACSKTFGYKSTGRKHEVEIDEKRAEVVREVFKLYAEGATFPEMAEAVGPKMLKLGTRVYKAHIFRMLRNPIYCGFYKGDDGRLIKSKPTEGKEIISFKLWKTAQEIYENRKRNPRRAYHNWLPLSGKIICGYCGYKMKINSTALYGLRYTCYGFRERGLPRSKSCRNSIIWKRDDRSVFGDTLLDVLMGLLPLYYMHKLDEASRSTEKAVELQDAEVKVMSTQAKIKTLTSSFVSGDIDESVYKQALVTLNKKLKDEKAVLDELNAVKGADDYTPTRLLFDLEALNAGDVNQADLEEAMRWTFKEITVWHDKVEISTPLGKVTFFTRRLGVKSKAKLFPFHFIAAGKGECDVVYNWKCREPNSEADIIDYENDGEVIGDFGRVRIWLVR